VEVSVGVAHKLEDQLLEVQEVGHKLEASAWRKQGDLLDLVGEHVAEVGCHFVDPESRLGAAFAFIDNTLLI